MGSGHGDTVAQFLQLPGTELTGCGGGGDELPGSRLSRGQQNQACWSRPRDSPGGGRDRASWGEGLSLGFWSAEQGDRNICSCPGKTRLCLEQDLTSVLTSSLPVLASIPHSPLHSFECLTIWGLPGDRVNHRARGAKRPICPGAHSHEGLEFRFLTLALEGQCGIVLLHHWSQTAAGPPSQVCHLGLCGFGEIL